MATTTPIPEVDLSNQLSGGRRARNILSTVWMWGSFVVAVVPLLFIVGYVIREGLSVLNLSFLSTDIQPAPSERRGVGGIWPAIWGTIIITLGAAAMAVPLGLLGAIYLNEYGKTNSLAKVIRFMSDVMTGVPSIVMGLFVYTAWVLRFGTSGFAGSLALACLMLPIVIRSCEEILRLVPDELRNGSYALGNRKWRTIVQVVLPAALPGITSGVMLAVARAAGETAPLLFTVGIVYKANYNLFLDNNVALPQLIFEDARNPQSDLQLARAWGAAFTLIVIVLVLTIIARWVAGRFSIKES